MDAVLKASGYCPFLNMHDGPYATLHLPPAAEMVAQEAELRPKREDRLKKGIAEFYDESSDMWERLWGDHMHHGFYDPGEKAEVADHRRAQVRMIEEALAFANVTGFASFCSFSFACFLS